MNCILLKKEEQLTSQWTGGTTRQFAIYPLHARGATDFDYEFEVTSSTMDYNKTQYTLYTGYHRILMIIDGAVKLFHEDNTTVNLSPFEFTEFKGDMLTYSYGYATDYELMIRRGNAGTIGVLTLKETVEEITLNNPTDYRQSYYGFYSVDGAFRFIVDKTEYKIDTGDHLSFYLSERQTQKVFIHGKGNLIKSVIHFNAQNNATG